MATKLDREVSYIKELLPIRSHSSLVTRSCEITWQTKNVLSQLRMLMVTKLDREVNFHAELPPIILLDLSITLCEVMRQIKIYLHVH